ncbi:MAG: hypothetical protein ACI4AK_00615 [Lepagella sp.]
MNTQDLKHRLLLLFLMLTAGISGMNAAGYQSIIVTTPGGEDQIFSLEGEGVKVTPIEGAIRIENSDKSVEIASTEVVNISFYNPAGVLQTSAQKGRYYISSQELRVEGLAPGTGICISDLAGKIISRGVCDSTGSFTATLAGSGIYIFSSKNFTFKFIVR